MLRSIHKYRDATLALICAMVFTVSVEAISNNQTTKMTPELTPPSNNQDIYVIGNSMFGTGFSIELARSLLPERNVDFAYYNGHYSSMWHLAVTIGMNRYNAPKQIIWGFRPTYAIFPAFRQNKNTKQSDFSKYMSDRHRNILKNAADPAYKDLSYDKQVKRSNQLGASDNELFQIIGSMLANFFISLFKVVNGEIETLNYTTNAIKKIITRVFSTLDLFPFIVLESKHMKPRDLLIQYVTNGEIQIADAQVIDNGERFVKGEMVAFSRSFVPEISEAISRIGRRQIVVIFRPVKTFTEPLTTEFQSYYDDAISYFKMKGVPVIDLLKEPGLKLNMYAKGDHLNQAGRVFVTQLIAEEIKKN